MCRPPGVNCICGRFSTSRAADESSARHLPVVGVYSADLVEKLAEALSMLGLRRALVVHGSDGLDEITITGPPVSPKCARDKFGATK
jgi:hypothetical protein